MKRTLAILCFLLALAAPAAARDTEALPERYVSDDERITFNYPTGWVVDSNTPELISVNTDRSLIDGSVSGGVMPSGEAAIIMLFGLDTAAFATGDDSFVEGDAVSTLSYLIKFLIPAQSSTDFSPLRELTVGGYAAAQVFGESEGNDVFLVLVSYDADTVAFMIAATARGEMPKYAPKLTAIVESVNYAPD